jgi:hypothetical protein
MTTKRASVAPLGSLDLVRAVLRHPGLSDRESRVLAEIATHDPARFVPTIGVLARCLYGTDDARSREYVRRVLRSLEAKDVLEVEYRAGRVVGYSIHIGASKRKKKNLHSAGGASLSRRSSTLRVEGSTDRVEGSTQRVDPSIRDKVKDNSKAFKKGSKTREPKKLQRRPADRNSERARRIVEFVASHPGGVFMTTIGKELFGYSDGQMKANVLSDLLQLEELELIEKNGRGRWVSVDED